MAYTKKPASGAFGDVLAGLGPTADRPSAGPAHPPREGVKAGAGLDTAWVQSARMRALAAQMAHRVTASAAEPPPAGAGDHRRSGAEDLAANWRSATADRPSRRDQSYVHEARSNEAVGYAEPSSAEPSTAEAPGAAPSSAAAAPEAPAGGVAPRAPSRGMRPNPVHAMQRMLAEIPRRLWANAGSAASALGAVGGGRHPEPAPKPAAANPPPARASLRKSEDETIAEELGLREDLAIGELRRIRRDFAKKNHPDRFEPALRVGAARRMTIANMLIDARLKQRLPSP